MELDTQEYQDHTEDIKFGREDSGNPTISHLDQLTLNQILSALCFNKDASIVSISMESTPYVTSSRLEDVNTHLVGFKTSTLHTG